MDAQQEPALQQNKTELNGGRLAVLSLAALGVVYGDIGTSPLYAIRECFHGEYGISPTHANILGVLSLMFWSLLLIVSIKYLGFILRADNNGEGGVVALTALAGRGRRRSGSSRWLLLGMGLFAGALLYGDGMITPAISVLSAVEGLRIMTPALQPFVIPVTVAILAGLFLLQRHGTTTVGSLFGPVTLVWFVVIAVLGLNSIIHNPSVLMAVNPWFGASFLIENRLHGFIVLGAVFLVVTGAEALYADLGHFGRRPIRLAWFTIVLPALLCNYFGQGALLLARPVEAHHPFYALAPSWSLVPLVILATTATVIASQAVITGAFSLTYQAIQLGYLPRLRVIHTSATEMGQVFVPRVNWLLMLTTIGLVLGFQTSSKLAAAYGVAVTTTMVITSILLFLVARERWNWSQLRAGLLVGLFIFVDLSFFAANLGKITHGAWFPLAVGGVVYFLMTTWRKGRTLLAQKLYAGNPSLADFLRSITENPPMRVPGKAVYLAGRTDTTPPALLNNLKHNKSLHSAIVILTVRTEPVPRVERDKKVEIEDLGNSFYRIFAHHGFMEEASVPYILALAREEGLDFKLEEVTFVLGRERLLQDRRPLMSSLRESIFGFVSHNTEGPTAYFKIPPDQVLEVGSQITI
jgi:KUP system potassium uptake protein